MQRFSAALIRQRAAVKGMVDISIELGVARRGWDGLFTRFVVPITSHKPR